MEELLVPRFEVRLAFDQFKSLGLIACRAHSVTCERLGRANLFKTTSSTAQTGRMRVGR